MGTRVTKTFSDDVITRVGSALPFMWLFSAVYPIEALLASHEPVGVTVPLLLSVTFVVILYLRLVLRGPFRESAKNSSSVTRVYIALSLMALFSFVCLWIGGLNWLQCMTLTAVTAGYRLPTTLALRTLGVLAGLTVMVSLWHHAPLWFALPEAIVQVGGFGVVQMGFLQLAKTVHQLRRARDELARLAVYEERTRMARDLHDLLGHSLSLVAVKSELAKRLVEVDPDEAVSEISDIERISREALGDVRAAVGAYRRTTIHGEIASAEEILAAAGIEVEVSIDSGDLPSEVEGVIAWTIREGTTNVIRHSRARRCAISISREGSHVRCRVANDRSATESGPDATSFMRSGHGLAGLSERVRKHLGEFEAGIQTDGEFILAVAIPLKREELTV